MWCCASKLQGFARLLRVLLTGGSLTWWRKYGTSALFAISWNDFGALSVPVVRSRLRVLRIRIKGDAQLPGATSTLPFRKRVRIVARNEQKSIFR